MDVDQLITLIQDIKPSLQGAALSPDNSLVDDLGLDSLDLLQLGRRIQRAAGVPFVHEDWAGAERCKQGPRFTIAALQQAVAALAQPNP
jgi:acyl carrier protein